MGDGDGGLNLERLELFIEDVAVYRFVLVDLCESYAKYEEVVNTRVQLPATLTRLRKAGIKIGAKQLFDASKSFFHLLREANAAGRELRGRRSGYFHHLSFDVFNQVLNDRGLRLLKLPEFKTLDKSFIEGFGGDNKVVEHVYRKLHSYCRTMCSDMVEFRHK